MDKTILIKLQKKCEKNARQKLNRVRESTMDDFCKGLNIRGVHLGRVFKECLDTFVETHEKELLSVLEQAEEDKFFRQLSDIEALLVRQCVLEDE